MSIIGIFGLSGVGKSYHSSEIKEHLTDFIFIKASDLLRTRRAEVEFNNLNKDTVILNQLILLEEISKVRMLNDDVNILIELHNIIELPSGIEVLKNDMFKVMKLKKAIFIEISPVALHGQRIKDLTRNRKSLSIIELYELQKVSKTNFLKMSEENDTPVIVVNAKYENVKDKIIEFITESD